MRPGSTIDFVAQLSSMHCWCELVANRDVNSYLLYWRSDGLCNISSYTPKTAKGKKNVMVVSTVEPLMGVTKDDKTKPAVIKLYDFTKGGTDIVDQKMGAYTTKSKSRKWSKVVFFYLLDTIRVNASTVFALATKKSPTKINSFDFGVELADSLIRPYLTERSQNGLQSVIQAKMILYTGETVPSRGNEAPHPRISSTKGRCRSCLSDIQGDGYKAMNDNLPKLKTNCQRCGNKTCAQHSMLQCKNCLGI